MGANGVVVCADIGSIKQGKFAWWSSRGTSSDDIGELAEHVAAELQQGSLVALGFECPTWIPIPFESEDIGRARPGEGARAWSAGAGAGALATGIAQIGWILDATVAKLGSTPVTTNRDRWAEQRPLLLWEGFVSHNRKPAASEVGEHVADARAAVEAFGQNRVLPVDVPATKAINLLAMAAAWAGMSVGLDEYGRGGPIYAPPESEEHLR